MKELLEEIKQSFNLLSLKEGWDDEDALPMNEKAYSRALELLFRLINEIGSFETPDINLCNDGSVDISFSNENKPHLLINVKDYMISWYGCDSLGKNQINDNQTKLFNEELFNWVKIHLKK